MSQQFPSQELVVLWMLLLLLPGMGQSVAAQQGDFCGTAERDAAYFHQHPEEEADYRAVQRQYQDFMATRPDTAGTRNVKTIPCVVHVIQSSIVNELSDADIQTQIEVLNEDFRKIAGTPGDGAGVDTEYQFCLASIDPQGCATTGINRIVNPGLASHDFADQALLKGLIQWDPNMYLNLWVPTEIVTQAQLGLIVGYATFPDQLPSQPELDGVVVGAQYFVRSPVSAGRTATHEVGHWLGLYHPFQGGCSGVNASDCSFLGDEVCDTPQSSDPNTVCSGSPNTCIESPVDLPNQVDNYMDYAIGSCVTGQFTQGQKDRMDFFYTTYRSNLSSAANLSATGCDGTLASTCPPTSNFSADARTTCVGQPVTFSDLSNGPPSSWNWTFPGGIPATSTDQNPVVTWAQTGTYSVGLEVTNAKGTDSRTETAFITVQETQLPPLSENFDNVPDYPDGWYPENLADTLNWRKSNEAAYSDAFSMQLELFGNPNQGAFYSLNTAAFDLSGVATANLSWRYAYKRFSAFNNIDTLQVRASVDCGANWNLLWQRAGTQLASVGGNGINARFVPADSSQWSYVEIPVDTYAGRTQVRFQFRAISGGGQNLWLDDVNLSALVNAAEVSEQLWGLEVYPNPFREVPTVAYSLAQGSELSFSLVDLQGRTLFQYDVGRQAPGEYVLAADPDIYATLPPGIYFLRAESEFGNATKKLIKMAP